MDYSQLIAAQRQPQNQNEVDTEWLERILSFTDLITAATRITLSKARSLSHQKPHAVTIGSLRKVS